MAGGIQKSLLSADLIPSIGGLKRIRNSLLPVSGGGAYTPEASNKIVFQLQSFEVGDQHHQNHGLSRP